MAGSAVFKGFNVVFNCARRNAHFFSAAGKHFRVVDTVSTTGNFFSAHEEVVRVCVSLILGVQHSVEGAGGFRIAIKHVKVSVVLFFDDCSECALCLSAQIFEGVLLAASSSVEHLDSIAIVKLDNRIGALKFFEGILLVDD